MTNAYRPPYFPAHLNPELMQKGPEFARQKLTEAETELEQVTPVAVKRETGEDLEAFKKRYEAARLTGKPAAVPSVSAKVALYRWAVAEHEKVPVELRHLYPVKKKTTCLSKEMMLPSEPRNPEGWAAYDKRLAAMPNKGWHEVETEIWCWSSTFGQREE